MRAFGLLGRLAAFLIVVLILPVAASAQEATLTGTITDSTGGVLPGVTVQATNVATGNNFEAVTDERGIYRIPARVGAYRITATLVGFSTVTRTGVELLVGQTATLNMQMAPSALQETVTVTGEAPLIETSRSSVGGNIDPRQLSELPANGRNWMSLALLAPGNRTNAEGDTPVQDRTNVREFQLNVDGVQVSQQMGIGGQPMYSRESVGEFQFISNRFDATQGRSSGVQVNVVTKSGSNTPSGSFVGNFRDSRFIAKDPVLNRVLPYKDQQYAGTFGGPIVRDKLHFFVNYEYEHQPLTSIWNTPYPAFNVSRSGVRSVKMPSARLDYQLSNATRLMVKGGRALLFEPFGAGNNNHPAATNSNRQYSSDAAVQLTHVAGNKLNELKVGYAASGFDQESLTTWSRHWLAPTVTNKGPNITLTGFAITGNSNLPRYRDQDTYNVRDDFSYSYGAKGRHDVKTGGEYIRFQDATRNCSNCMGAIDARGGPVPANVEALFPDPWNADTWNLAAISPLVRTYTIGVSSNGFRTPIILNKYGAWYQDDWKLSQRVTLNLGVRYDLIWNAFANWVDFPPFMQSGRPQDANNVQPRAGFAYSLNDRTVLRGGAGLYYADVLDTNVLWPESPLTIAQIQVSNDGRPDFAANPFNGPVPTYAQALQRFCYVSNVPGCLLRAAPQLAAPAKYEHVQHSWQSSIGVERQIGTAMAFDVDYVFTGSRSEEQAHRMADNINISFNPATGVNYPFSDASHRPYPLWGIVGMDPFTGASNYNGLQTSFTKRMSNHWQGSATYTLSTLKERVPPPMSGLEQVTFALAPDLAGSYALAATDQRHRATFNGIWQVAHGFQVSGLYFYGSGLRYATSWGSDLRQLGITGNDLLRADGTIIARNNLVGGALHRVDMRIQQHLPFRGRAGVDGILELFNVFDRANYGGYVTQESNRQYGQPVSSTNLAYAPRTLQLGFRVTF